MVRGERLVRPLARAAFRVMVRILAGGPAVARRWPSYLE